MAIFVNNFSNNETSLLFLVLAREQQCGQHVKEIDYGGWPAPRNHMTMKQGYEVSVSVNCTNENVFLVNSFFFFSPLSQAKMNDHHPNNLQKGE